MEIKKTKTKGDSMTSKFKHSPLRFVSFWVIALFVMQFSTALFGDCDMIGILIRNGQTITDVDQLGIQYPGDFDEPSDFWTWFKNTQVPRNISGYRDLEENGKKNSKRINK